MQLADALARGRPLLVDGAMGTSLIAMGLKPGEPPEGWITRHPGRVVAVHDAFLAVGADIILTNTFGANVGRLRAFGLETQCHALNARAAALARGAADGAGRPVIVAGTMGPPGLDVGAMPEREAADLYAAQADGLAAGGVDVAWLETIGTAAELRAAAAAAAWAGLAVVATASFEVEGRTRGGLTPQGFADALAGLEAEPVAAGANCGNGPADVLEAAQALRRHRPGAALVIKAGAGLPIRREEGFAYPVGPAAMAAYASRALAVGAGIVGGCCGTSAAHLGAMREALDMDRRTAPSGPQPPTGAGGV